MKALIKMLLLLSIFFTIVVAIGEDEIPPEYSACLCDWTPWMNSDDIDDDVDDESYSALRRRGYQFCKDPVAIQCVNSQTNVSVDPDSTVVTCDVALGLKCPIFCSDYKIKVACCYCPPRAIGPDFQIVSELNDGCLAVTNDTSSAVTEIAGGCEDSNPRQQWSWVSRSLLKNLLNQQCIAVEDSHVITAQCDAADRRQWWHYDSRTKELGSGPGYLSSHDGSFVDTPSSSRWMAQVEIGRTDLSTMLGFPCTREPMPPTNGSVRCSFGSYQGSVCEFSCAPGFTLPPTTKYPVTCLPKRQYNGSTPTCSRIICQPPLPTLSNGRRSCSDDAFVGSVCGTACDEGYELIGAAAETTCGTEGRWSAAAPTCKRIVCGPLLHDASVEHGFINCSNTNFLPSTCAYSCEAGYELNGPGSRICQRDGTWTGTGLSCTKIQCPLLTQPEDGRMVCSDQRYYASSCAFSCQLGYRLAGSGSVTCKSDRLWGGEPPVCERITCTTLAHPNHGSMTCSDGNFFGSLCNFRCDEGFRVTKTNSLTCGVNGWDHGAPECERIECSHQLAPINGNVTCSDKEYFASRCQFACDRRYMIKGTNVMVCGEDGWDFKEPPTCQKRTCPSYSDPRNGRAQCYPSRSYEVDSVCVISCNEGYVLNPPNPQPAACLESGDWERKQQTCKRIRCRSLSKLKLSDGGVVCSDENNYKSRCAFQCNDGYNLYGANETTCGAVGWSEQTPTCRRVQCGPQVPQLPHGQVKCSTKGALSCSYTCNPGFLLVGANHTQCQSNGTWSNPHAPECRRKKCSNSARSPPYGHVRCTDESLYGSVCNYSCDHGYFLVGKKLVECLETGGWNSAPPTCKRISCLVHNRLNNGRITCSEANNFGSRCQFVCEEGYELIGAHTARCLLNETWDSRMPYCERITCSPGFSNPSNGRVGCSDYSHYGSTCTFSCGKGFKLKGGNTTVCGTGGWSLDVAPSCSKITCPVRQHLFSDGTESCNRSNELHSLCTYSCNEGFELSGATRRRCQDSGQWSDAGPHCAKIDCPSVNPSPNTYMKCSLDFEFESECVFTCASGYLRNGPEKIVCTRNKSWNRNEPTRCELMPSRPTDPSSTGGFQSTTTSSVVTPTPPNIFGWNLTTSPSSQPDPSTSTTPGPTAAAEGAPVVVIVAAISGVVVLVAIVVLVVFVQRRRSKKRPPFKGISLRDRYDESQLQKLISSNGSQNRRFPAVLADRLESEFSRKHADDDKLFREEFAGLPEGHGSRDQGGRAVNKEKNRYTNIIPYDHSRVVLPRISGDDPDYINASFVDGYKHKGKFIAAQGPKDCTINDFWRMIWDQNVTTVIMVTNLVEGKETKCSQYWPQQGSQCYGELNVCFSSENHLVDYTVRKFTIQQVSGDSTLSMRRNLVHYHFTSWPDFGVPKSPSGMLKFLRKIKHGSPTGYGAVVVHCSAGVGRTGTFICLDAMLDMVTREGKIDVYGFVTQMRTQRPEMVQTEQQYIFIYQALLEHHLYGDTEVEAADVTMHIDELNKRLPGNVTGMEHEFKKLTTIRIQKEQMRAGNHPGNMRKNRVLLILPYDWNRAILPVKAAEENSDYINASYIDGYRQKDAYIATQGPLPHTVQDFWRLIWETKSASIVMLTELVERGQAKCEQYWPDSDVMIYGDLSVEHIGGVKLDYYTTRDFVLTSVADPGDRKQIVRQFHYHAWPESGPPVSGYSMIALVEQVQKQQQTSGNHPITIHCSAGAGRTGAFCALSTALEQVKAEGVLDMFQIVKCLRMQRPHMVQNLEQYEFCYRAVQEYVDSMSEYYNFK